VIIIDARFIVFPHKKSIIELTYYSRTKAKYQELFRPNCVISPGPDEAVYIEGKRMHIAGINVIDVLKIVDIVGSMNSNKCRLITKSIGPQAKLVIGIVAAGPGELVLGQDECMVLSAGDVYRFSILSPVGDTESADDKDS